MLKNEQLLSLTTGVILTCAQPLRVFYAKTATPAMTVQTVSGSLLITNYRILFQFPQGMLLNVPVRYVFGIKLDGYRLQLDFCNALAIELHGELRRAAAFLHGLLTPEVSQFYLFWVRQHEEGASPANYCIYKGKSFVYAYQYRRLAKEGLLSETQPSGRDLFDPFREFARQGVAIPQPSSEELSIMVFGYLIPMDLIHYLISKRPKYQRGYTESQTRMLAQKNKEYFGSTLFMQYRCAEEYDPRALFESDDSFYALLESHPCHTAQYLSEFQAQQRQLEEYIRQDEQLSAEESEDRTPAPLQQAKSIFSKIAKQINQFIAPDYYSEKAQFIPVYEAEIYCHGCFFGASFFRQSPQQRENLRRFIRHSDLEFDCVHAARCDGSPKFHISYLNAGYAVSPTYPALLAVPVTDETLHQAMKFRSRGRIAALSYVYYNRAYLTRCAQPGSGFGLTRDSADEVLLKSSCDGQLLVFDARPRLAAFGNILYGKGFESKMAYPFTQTYYCGIQNIHAIRRSAESVLKAICAAQADPSFDKQMLAQAFYDSRWFEHLQLIIFSSQQIAEHLAKKNISCMVHCSDGWDRTSQLTSLTMLLLDPYYRTVKGFCALIMKEWLSFGHMFATRNRQVGSTKASRRKAKEYFQCDDLGGRDAVVEQSSILEPKDPGFRPLQQSDYRYSASQTSPIFFQFLDGVYQLYKQFPSKFEFTPRLLVHMARCAFSGRFGDFQFDSERARTENLVFQATQSCFDDVLGSISRYVNPVYRPVDLSCAPADVLECSWSSRDFHVFYELWMM